MLQVFADANTRGVVLLNFATFKNLEILNQFLLNNFPPKYLKII